MKKNLLIACVIGFMSFFANSSQAQISVNFNVGAQPLWGPVGYDRANYYYLPDVDTYYSVADRKYIYQNDGRWTFSNALPSRYSGYNLYNGYKVVMNTPKPYLSHETNRVKYAKYKGYKNKQKAIRYSNDSKYYVVKGHPHGVTLGQRKKINTNTRTNYPVVRRNDRDNDRYDDHAKNKSHGNGKGKSHGGGKNKD